MVTTEHHTVLCALTVLSLLEKLCQSDSTVEERLRGSIQVRAKLGKGSNLTILSQLQLHGTCNLGGWGGGGGI